MQGIDLKLTKKYVHFTLNARILQKNISMYYSVKRSKAVL